MEDVNLVEINVLFFAKSRELAGITNTNISVPRRLTGKDLLGAIIAKFPSLAVIEENLLLSLNQEYLEKDTLVGLKGGEEVALIPPISGG